MQKQNSVTSVNRNHRIFTSNLEISICRCNVSGVVIFGTTRVVEWSIKMINANFKYNI